MEFDNFFVGAAGNLEEENKQGVSALSGPLMSRFKPIIVWETGTESTWNAAMDHLRKKWENKVGKDIIDLFNSNRELFDNPRDIERGMIQYIYNSRKAVEEDPSEASIYDAETVYEWVVNDASTIDPDDTKNSGRRSALKDMAQKISNYICTGNLHGTSGRSATKGRDMISKELSEEIKKAITSGYILYDNEKYGVSHENIYFIFEDMAPNKEMLERHIQALEKKGIKFKYEKDSDFKKNKELKDPRA